MSSRCFCTAMARDVLYPRLLGIVSLHPEKELGYLALLVEILFPRRVRRGNHRGHFRGALSGSAALGVGVKSPSLSQFSKGRKEMVERGGTTASLKGACVLNRA
jgi:hypothetical protein